MLDRGEPAKLHERRRAGRVVLDQLVVDRAHGHRMGQPAEPPAGHRPGLGERVDHDDRIVVVDVVEHRGRRFAVIGDAVVDLVGDQPDTAFATECDELDSLLFRHQPAGRVGRRAGEDDARARVHLGIQLVHLEPEPVVALMRRRGQVDLAGLRAHQVRDRQRVRPHRADHHHVVAGAEHRLGGEQDGGHAGRGDRNPPDVGARAVQPVLVARDCLAQLGDAALGRVPGIALFHGVIGRLADELGRVHVRLADPQRDHVRHVHAGLPDRHDLRFGQVGGQWVDGCGNLGRRWPSGGLEPTGARLAHGDPLRREARRPGAVKGVLLLAA